MSGTTKQRNPKALRFAIATMLVAMPAVALFPGATVALGAEPGLACAPLSGNLQWVSSLVWVPRENRLVLTDRLQQRAFYLSRDGALEPLEELNEQLRPLQIHALPNGFLIRAEGGKDFFLNPSLNLVDRVEVGDEPRSLEDPGLPGGRLGSLYPGWRVSASGDLFAYGSVISPVPPPGQLVPERKNFKLGLLHARYDAATSSFAQAQLLAELPDNDYYVFGFPVTAIEGNLAYFLNLESKRSDSKQPFAALLRVPIGAGPESVETLDVIPAEYRRIPVLKTPDTGPPAVVGVFAEIEKATMAVGVLGDGQGGIYLLARKPGVAKGTAVWSLLRVSEDGTKITGRQILPTNAPHLDVVTANDAGNWFLLERGSVKPDRTQDVRGIWTIPVRSIRAGELTRQMRCEEARASGG